MSRTFNMVGGGGGKAVLAVTVTNGTATSVTATKSGFSVSLTYSGGIWSAVLPSFGTWTVTITDGTHSNSATVNATTAGLYSVSIFMPDVPSAYTQLEWISSYGAQINTGYAPVSACRIYGKMQSTRSATESTFWDSWFGASQGSGTSRKIIYMECSNDHGGYLAYLNGTGDAYPNVDIGIGNQIFSAVYEFSTNGRTITVNGNPFTVTKGSAFTTPGENLSFGNRVKTWYFKMTAPDTTTIVRDYVPAKRNSDGVVGMYDKANNVFYSPTGSAVFTAGPAV